MLYAFRVQDYCNLNMRRPVILRNGLTFIYGSCGSGKTAFCRALGDIFDYSVYKGWKTARFYYCFVYGGYTLVYTYERAGMRKVKNAVIRIPQLRYKYNHTGDIYNPLHIFSLCRTSLDEKNICGILNMFEDYLLTKFHLYDEEEASLAEGLYDSTLPPVCLGRPVRTREMEAGHTVIIDDFEYNRCNKGVNAQMLACEMRAKSIQGVLTVRRSEWISPQYGEMGHYYFLRAGDLINAEQYLKKDIRSLNQLRQFFLKGVFDFESL